MGWLYNLIYKSKDDEIKSLKDSVASNESEYKARVWDLMEKIGNQSSEISELKRGKEEGLLASLWNDKYPKGRLTWDARSLPFSKTKIRVPLSTLITPTDPFIKSDLVKWKFLGNEEDFETLIPKIYKKIKDEYYNYEYDEKVWGNSEVFEFPFEMRVKAELNGNKYEYDCDSWAVFQASYYRACGFPAWRVRVVGGKTRNGGGHATIAIFSLKTNKWFHLNSTYGEHHLTISKFPSINEESDKIGISDVFFSFNDLYSWYEFEEDLPGDVSND